MSTAPLATGLPAGRHGRAVRVLDGPRLLAAGGVPGTTPAVDVAGLVALTRSCLIRGRGGAGFPFATKLETAARSRGRAVVVVNAAEGEPASAKDATLLLTVPHLVLDGAVAAARALGAGELHVVVPGDRPQVVAAVRGALAERAHRPRRERDPVRPRVHVAQPRFVAGQAQAVLQLLAGRPGLPVTAWQPEAVGGLRGRPTLLSNAETFAQVGAALRLGGPAYTSVGLAEEPGTVLLTVAGDTPDATVLEVATGTPLDDVLARTGHDPAGPVLTGGYHGRWLPAGRAARLPVGRGAFTAAGGALGAGVLLPLAPGSCPVARTATVVAYLATESAGRCGPCRNGLPALARRVEALERRGPATAYDVTHLASLVTGRGACAHPDGTARLVTSMLEAFPGEVAAHERGGCDVAEHGGWPR